MFWSGVNLKHKHVTRTQREICGQVRVLLSISYRKLPKKSRMRGRKIIIKGRIIFVVQTQLSSTTSITLTSGT